MKILLVAGARPNFMKIAPLVHELQRRIAQANLLGDGLIYKLVHTGQHYDVSMSKVFFEEFEIPEPDFFLNVGSGSHAEQTAKVMVEFEKICLKESPTVVLVVGDVNSTLACAITAKKMGIPVAHVEAGLRSGDMAMPEEINRVVTDSICDLCFITEKSGMEHLRREGRNESSLFFVGNIMIDTLFRSLSKLPPLGASRPTAPPAVVTLHRPSNVDHPAKLEEILSAIREIADDMPVHFPIHPRTCKRIDEFGLAHWLEHPGFHLHPPLSYLDFLAIWREAALVLTDSGGIQEETSALGIPCFTIRENTERPITLEDGSNLLVGTTRDGILAAYRQFKMGHRKQGKIPELWDGRTAKRIVDVLLEQYPLAKVEQHAVPQIDLG